MQPSMQYRSASVCSQCLSENCMCNGKWKIFCRKTNLIEESSKNTQASHNILKETCGCSELFSLKTSTPGMETSK